MRSCLKDEARERSIGWYHRNPDESHLHSLVESCLKRTLAAGDYPTISGNINDAIASLAPHKYEWDWDRTARLTPKIAEQIVNIQSVANGSPSTVDLSSKFTSVKTPLVYTAESSDPTIATVSLNGSTLTVNPLLAGISTITVRATNPLNLYVEQTFTITAA